MNVKELSTTDWQPSLWIFFLIATPIALAFAAGLYRLRKWRNKRVARSRIKIMYAK